MKTGKRDEMHVPDSPQGTGRQVSGEKSGERAGIAQEQFSATQGGRSSLLSARQTHLGEHAATVVCLQRLLADVYPELARIQRFEAKPVRTCR